VELEESLEELKQFNYIASHDIKEPMRVVSSVTGLIEKKLQKENNEKYTREFGLVKSSITQLYTLIEDLSQFLDFKAKSITHQIVDTNQLAGQISQMLSELTHDINGKIYFENLPKIYSSTSLLTVIMKNLVENGLKYNTSNNPTVNIGYKLNKERHEFTFTDNKRLESREKKGSGLGLGLVSKAVEKLDGEIKLESALNSGSSFTISLPQSYVIQN